MKREVGDTLRILYLDCTNGISGDMALGALLALTEEKGLFLRTLQSLSISREYQMELEEKMIAGERAVNVLIDIKEKYCPFRNLYDIHNLIKNSGLTEKAKEKASRAFQKLAEVEAHVHDIPIDQVHFHETGATDTILDITGTALLLDLLTIDKLMFSKINLGDGVVYGKYGKMEVPAPAVRELVKGYSTYQTKGSGELTTPTGATILSMGEQGDLPLGKVLSKGYGIGKRSHQTPSLLSAVIIEKCNEKCF